jgi:hypothetical protein
MINALLRERKDHPLGKSKMLVECLFSEDCIKETMAIPDKIALSLTYGEKPVKMSVEPFIINITTLTSSPIYENLSKVD